jgi:hypothetical protein
MVAFVPLCQFPTGGVVTVDNPGDCIQAGGQLVDSGGGAVGGSFCFVRNVLTRALAASIVDIGASDAIRAEVVETLTIPPARKKSKRTHKGALVSLTAATRRKLTGQTAQSILTLAETYRTTIDFRDELLLTTPRGRQLKAHYDKYLGEIYNVAYQSKRLVFDSAMTWLAVYPFTAGMVAVADRREGGKAKSGPKLSPPAFKRCLTLMRRYREGSKDEGFRKLLGELEQEFAGYEGLNSEQAVARLRESPTKE